MLSKCQATYLLNVLGTATRGMSIKWLDNINDVIAQNLRLICGTITEMKHFSLNIEKGVSGFDLFCISPSLLNGF